MGPYTQLTNLANRIFNKISMRQIFFLEKLDDKRNNDILQTLERLRDLPKTKLAYMDSGSTFMLPNVNRLFQYLVTHYPEYLEVLYKYFTSFSIINYDSIPNLDYAIKYIKFGSITGLEQIPDEPANWNFRTFIMTWCNGSINTIIDIATRSDKPEALQLLLASLDYFSIEQTTKLFKKCTKRYNKTHSEFLVNVVQQVPWWKYELNLKDSTVIFRLPHIIRLKSGKRSLRGISFSPQLGINDIPGKTFLDLTFPRFDPKEVRYYPKKFLQTAKSVLLLFNHLKIPRVIARFVLLDYVLFNSFWENMDKFDKLNQCYEDFFTKKEEVIAEEFLMKGFVPKLMNQDLYAGVMSDTIIGFPDSDNDIVAYVHNHYTVRFRSSGVKKLADIARIQTRPEETVEYFKNGRFYLINADHLKFLEPHMDHLMQHYGKHFNAKDLVSWIK